MAAKGVLLAAVDFLPHDLQGPANHRALFFVASAIQWA